MAPELFQEAAYSAKVDIYAFGVLLNEMLTRQRPFGDLAAPGEIRARVLEGGRPDLYRGQPSGAQSLVERCWAQSPADRPDLATIAAELTRLSGEC